MLYEIGHALQEDMQSKNVDSTFDTTEDKKHARDWGNTSGPMHAVFAFLAPSPMDKKVLRMQYLNKHTYNIIVPKWKPTIKVPQKYLLIRLMNLIAIKHSNKRIEVADSDMQWVTASFVRKMV